MLPARLSSDCARDAAVDAGCAVALRACAGASAFENAERAASVGAAGARDPGGNSGAYS